MCVSLCDMFNYRQPHSSLAAVVTNHVIISPPIPLPTLRANCVTCLPTLRANCVTYPPTLRANCVTYLPTLRCLSHLESRFWEGNGADALFQKSSNLEEELKSKIIIWRVDFGKELVQMNFQHAHRRPLLLKVRQVGRGTQK